MCVCLVLQTIFFLYSIFLELFSIGSMHEMQTMQEEESMVLQQDIKIKESMQVIYESEILCHNKRNALMLSML